MDSSVVWTSLQKPGKAGVDGRLVGIADAKAIVRLGMGLRKPCWKGLESLGLRGVVTHSNGEVFCVLDSWAGVAAGDTAGPHLAAGRC